MLLSCPCDIEIPVPWIPMESLLQHQYPPTHRTCICPDFLLWGGENAIPKWKFYLIASSCELKTYSWIKLGSRDPALNRKTCWILEDPSGLITHHTYRPSTPWSNPQPCWFSHYPKACLSLSNSVHFNIFFLIPGYNFKISVWKTQYALNFKYSQPNNWVWSMKEDQQKIRQADPSPSCQPTELWAK